MTAGPSRNAPLCWQVALWVHDWWSHTCSLEPGNIQHKTPKETRNLLFDCAVETKVTRFHPQILRSLSGSQDRDELHLEEPEMNFREWAAENELRPRECLFCEETWLMWKELCGGDGVGGGRHTGRTRNRSQKLRSCLSWQPSVVVEGCVPLSARAALPHLHSCFYSCPLLPRNFHLSAAGHISIVEGGGCVAVCVLDRGLTVSLWGVRG